MTFANRRRPRRSLHHFTFSPKYRRAVLENPLVIVAVTDAIVHICKLKGIQILALSVEADHVHLFCHLPRDLSQARAMFFVKWYSAIQARRLCPWLKTTVHDDHLWQRGYWVTTVGASSAKATRKYVDNQ